MTERPVVDSPYGFDEERPAERSEIICDGSARFSFDFPTHYDMISIIDPQVETGKKWAKMKNNEKRTFRRTFGIRHSSDTRRSVDTCSVELVVVLVVWLLVFSV